VGSKTVRTGVSEKELQEMLFPSSRVVSPLPKPSTLNPLSDATFVVKSRKPPAYPSLSVCPACFRHSFVGVHLHAQCGAEEHEAKSREA
jgi:hypothetical protein